MWLKSLKKLWKKFTFSLPQTGNGCTTLLNIIRIDYIGMENIVLIKNYENVFISDTIVPKNDFGIFWEISDANKLVIDGIKDVSTGFDIE